MIRLTEVDYATTGLSIQAAFTEAVEAAPPLPKPLRTAISVRWDGHDIVGGDIFDVPNSGRFRLEFLDIDTTVRQGADIQAFPGSELVGERRAPLLRTWYDPDLPASVEYDYLATDGILRTSNVYEVVRSSGIHAERWTENAGMWVEEVAELDRIYHCSHGTPGSPATFDALVYRLTIF